jgi:hypothetical protein
MGELKFFNSSAESLASDYVLETVALVVRSRKQLGEELAKRMLSNARFGIVLEGTEGFRRMMEELGNDTIWSNA